MNRRRWVVATLVVVALLVGAWLALRHGGSVEPQARPGEVPVAPVAPGATRQASPAVTDQPGATPAATVSASPTALPRIQPTATPAADNPVAQDAAATEAAKAAVLGYVYSPDTEGPEARHDRLEVLFVDGAQTVNAGPIAIGLAADHIDVSGEVATMTTTSWTPTRATYTVEATVRAVAWDDGETTAKQIAGRATFVITVSKQADGTWLAGEMTRA